MYPFSFPFIFSVIGVLALDLSIGSSIILIIGFYSVDYPRLKLILPGGIHPISQLISLGAISTLLISTSKSHIQASIKNFILNQKMLERERKVNNSSERFSRSNERFFAICYLQENSRKTSRRKNECDSSY